jgi:hypothetical protein
MKAKIEFCRIPGIPFPVRCVVITGAGFIAYRKGGREIFRLVDKQLN